MTTRLVFSSKERLDLLFLFILEFLLSLITELLSEELYGDGRSSCIDLVKELIEKTNLSVITFLGS